MKSGNQTCLCSWPHTSKTLLSHLSVWGLDYLLVEGGLVTFQVVWYISWPTKQSTH